MLLIGGGSGMSRFGRSWADHIASEEQRPVRFFYGPVRAPNLFYLEELAAIAAQLRTSSLYRRLSTRRRMTSGRGDRIRP